jgi:hypothetical protein
VRKRCRKSGRACARLEGWDGGNPPHASRRIAALRRLLQQPASRCDAPQHEGKREPCILAKRTQRGACVLIRTKNQLAGVGNDRPPRTIVQGLLFTMENATRACGR